MCKFLGTPSHFKDGRQIVPRFIPSKDDNPGIIVVDITDSNTILQTIPLDNTIEEKNYSRTTAWVGRENLRELAEMVEPGDLIEFERFHYMHWAVILGVGHSGNDKLEELFIVHFSKILENHKKIMRIHVARLVDVKVTSRVRINNESDIGQNPARRAFSVNCLIERIEEFWGRNQDYILARNNCEHFATYCRYHEAFSLQSGKLCKIPEDFEPSHVLLIIALGGFIGLCIDGQSNVTNGLGHGAVVGLGFFILLKGYQFVRFNIILLK